VRRVRQRLLEHRGEAIGGEVGLIDHFVNDGVRFWAVGEIGKSAASPPTSQQSISFARQGLRFRCLAILIGKHH
jgi:hypothetical protein